jgi:hypothetical protein
MRYAAWIAMVALTACGRATTVPSLAPPAVVHLHPGMTQYLMAEHIHVEQEFRGHPIVTDAATQVALTVALDSASPGFVLEVSLDSAAVAGDGGYPTDVVAAATGARFQARLSAGGAVRELTATGGGGALREHVALALYDLVPRLPPDGAHATAIWQDTTTASGRTGGIPITLERRSTHQAAGWIENGGERALSITTVTDYSLRGEGERSGQWITMTGTGMSHQHRLITDAGVVALGIWSDTLHAEVELSGSTLVIPLTQIRTDTVRRVN